VPQWGHRDVAAEVASAVAAGVARAPGTAPTVQPTVPLGGDQPLWHGEGVDERGQRRRQLSGHALALPTLATTFCLPVEANTARAPRPTSENPRSLPNRLVQPSGRRRGRSRRHRHPGRARSESANWPAQVTSRDSSGRANPSSAIKVRPPPRSSAALTFHPGRFGNAHPPSPRVLAATGERHKPFSAAHTEPEHLRPLMAMIDTPALRAKSAIWSHGLPGSA
jgi:hypothetical protein